MPPKDTGKQALLQRTQQSNIEALNLSLSRHLPIVHLTETAKQITNMYKV